MSFEGFAAAPSALPRAARLQALLFSRRNWLAGLPLVAALLLATPPGATRLAPALVLATLGAALRGWCVVFNRYAQGERKSLATGGPYAWVRNPLYVGNILVILGAAVLAGPLWLVPLVGAWAFLVYDQVVRHEERRLTAKYGEAYAAYGRAVSRWVPRLSSERRSALRALAVQSRTLLLLVPFLAKLWLAS